MRRLVAARLRHQPAQAVLVTLLAALVSLSAVLGVAYARAVEASVQHQTLAEASASARGVSIGATAASPPLPQQLEERLAPELRAPVWGTPVGGASTCRDRDADPTAGYGHPPGHGASVGADRRGRPHHL